MRGLWIHTVVYLAVNALLVGLWVIFSGSTTELGDILSAPSTALDEGFWPILVILGWGVGLAIHAAVALADALSPTARRARKEEKRREQQRRRIERKIERGKARGEELLTTAAQAAVDSAFAAVGSLGRRDEQPPTEDRPLKHPTGPRWVVVMFTDIVNSTSLAESMGNEAWSQALANHRRIVRECLAKHGGDEIGTQGDGFLVRHDSPAGAVDTAIAIQKAHDKRREGRQFVPHLRIGIHAGDAVHDDDGDLIGQVVNLAARVTAAAEPDQVLVTEPVADRLGSEVKLEECGLHDLRGVARPRHLLAVLY